MAVVGILTNLGISKSIDLANEEGFQIIPYRFAVTESIGDLLPTRDLASMLPQWYQGFISSAIKLNDTTVQLACNIPAELTPDPRFTKEIYIIAKDQFDNDFLLALAQPTTELTYDPDGELRIRIQITLDNVQIGDLYTFIYTQATEIQDHNNDPNAHPAIQQAMNKAGIFVQQIQNRFTGQNFIAFAPRALDVITGLAVFYNSLTVRYERGLAFDSFRKNVVGLYDTINNTVVTSGVFDFVHSLPAYTPIYLSSTSNGGLTTNRTDVQVAIALPTNKIFINVKLIEEDVVESPDGDFTINLVPEQLRLLTLQDANGINWDVEVDDDGNLVTIPNSLRQPDSLFRVSKPDFSFAQLIVKTDGELIVESPPLVSGLEINDSFYLASPNGLGYRLKVLTNNTVVTEPFLNTFLIRSENSNHFAVRQVSGDFALTYIQNFASNTLPSTPPEVTGLSPFCMYFDGTNFRPIFWDGGNWRYFSNNNIV
jgi:hypothetical protein